MRPILIFLFVIITLNSSGQFYPLEAGIVGGYSSGLNFRAYLDEQLSYEAVLSFRNEGLQFNMYRQEHNELNMNREGSLFFVYGFGAHAGFYYTDHYNILFRDVYFGRDLFSPVIGADGYAGLEFRFHEMPFSLGFAYRPYMELSVRQIFGINLWDFGFSLKYRFKAPNNFY